MSRPGGRAQGRGPRKQRGWRASDGGGGSGSGGGGDTGNTASQHKTPSRAPRHSFPSHHHLHHHPGHGAPEVVTSLLGQIEEEFELLRMENLELRTQVEVLEENQRRYQQALVRAQALLASVAQQREGVPGAGTLDGLTAGGAAIGLGLAATAGGGGEGGTASSTATTMANTHDPVQPAATPDDKGKGGRVSRKMRKAVYQAAVGTNKRFVPSMFRSERALDSEHLGTLSGHADGVWEVHCSSREVGGGQHLVASASADQTARVWDPTTRLARLVYQGHSGSVNSVRFHPTAQRACTASGDHTVHIWPTDPDAADGSARPRRLSLTERGLAELAAIESQRPGTPDTPEAADQHGVRSVEQPLASLSGHRGVCIAAAWMPGGDKIASASWDRTARLWDANTAQSLLDLTGHDLELTGVCTHPTKRLIVTSSRDTTFRLWDFRNASISEVNVFQGHTDTVVHAVLTAADNVISASDDRTVKIWDLRNMRSAITTIRTDSGPNRVRVSPNQSMIAVAMDHKNIKLFDLSGSRLARVPRRGREGHRRVVTAAAWGDAETLYSSSFDHTIMQWRVHE